MDPLFFVGLLLSLAGLVVSTIMDGNSFGPLIGPSSLVMVIVGALGASLMAQRKTDLAALPKALTYAFTGKPAQPGEAVTALAKMAEIARREGMLAVEGELENVDDEFIRQGLQLVVDGLEASDIDEIMQIDLDATTARHQQRIAFFKSAAGYAPTFGMIGTVVGLINMLGNLSDPSQLGKGMSLALLTTLYGVMFANLVFGPVAEKLKRLHEDEMAAREVARDGIIAIHSGTSPRILVERLETFLPRAERVGHSVRTGGPAPAPPESASAA